MGYREPVDPEAYRRQNDALRRLAPGRKLAIALRMSDASRAMLKKALRRVMPGATEAEVHARYLERLALCRQRTS